MSRVGIASLVSIRGDGSLDERELVRAVVGRAIAASGVTRAQIGATVSASNDLVVGMPFSFVGPLDVIGAWPPISESHVETDGIFALWEAWLRLTIGDLDAALVYAFGRGSAGDQGKVSALALDPILTAPLAPDASVLERLQLQAAADAGVLDAVDVPTGPSPPAVDGAVAMVLVREPLRARAWITGFDQRIDHASVGWRDLVGLPHVRAAGGGAGMGAAERIVLSAPWIGQAALVADALGAPRRAVRLLDGPVAPMAAGLDAVGAALRWIDDGARVVGVIGSAGPALQHVAALTLEAP